MLAVLRRNLADLPPPSLDIFALHPSWCPIPARVLTEALNVDHGLLGVWRMRGLGPKALPAEWTKGRSHVYLISDALAWLAARCGETFDPLDAWRQSLRINFGEEAIDPNQVRTLAHLYAKAAGARVGDVAFTGSGFEAYLAALSPSSEKPPSCPDGKMMVLQY